MPSEKISEMPEATAIADADLLTIVQGGVNKKVPWSVLKTAIQALNLTDFADASDFAQIDSFADDGYTYVAGGKLKTDAGMVRNGANNVQIGGILNVNQAQIVAALQLVFLAGAGVLKLDGANNVGTDSQIIPDGSGSLNILGVLVAATLSAGSGGFTVDSFGGVTAALANIGGGDCTISDSGVINAMEIHAANGESVSHEELTFTDGILTGVT